MTEAAYNSAIAIYNANGGKKAGKIYDVRDTDNTTPNDLTVTGGGGTRINKTGVVEDVAATMPKIDYSTGSPAFKVERAETNIIPHSYDLTQWWTLEYTFGTRTLTETGIKGLPNTATLLTDNNTGEYYGLREPSSVSMPDNTKKARASVWIKKDTDQARFPEIYIWVTETVSGTSPRVIIQLNTETGAFAHRTYTSGTTVVKDRGLWWEILWQSDLAITTLFQCRLRPAMTNIIGGATPAATGSIIVGHFSVVSSDVLEGTPIITNGATVTRPNCEASITTPAGVTSIVETIDGVENAPITTIPATYKLPYGNVNNVIFN